METTLPKKITAIIIDDEELARKVIVKYLETHPEIEVLEQCENGFTGLKAISKHKPDIVFLDIQMPKINGFELLEILEEKPLIVFSTAHDEFAIRAFEHNAVDYLLKPYSQKRFSESVERAVQKLNSGPPVSKEIDNLKEELTSVQEVLHRVVVKNGSQVEVIPTDAIEFLEAADDYVEIHTGSDKLLKQQTLTWFEQRLDSDKFIRVHRSFIVAIARISKIEPYSKDSFVLTLKSGKEVNVSKAGMKSLKEKLSF